MSSEAELRAAMVDACRALNRLGINQGRAGNVSVRFGDAMLISPSAIPYERLSPVQIARMSLDAEDAWSGPNKPSTEWRMHRDLMRARSEFAAVVHTHPPACTALAVARRGIPPCHYMVALFGGADVRCATYATFGSQELSDAVGQAMEDRSACLMANHGALVGGTTLAQALARSVELEALARHYLAALQSGRVVLLSDHDIVSAAEQFRDYGGLTEAAPDRCRAERRYFDRQF